VGAGFVIDAEASVLGLDVTGAEVQLYAAGSEEGERDQVLRHPQGLMRRCRQADADHQMARGAEDRTCDRDRRSEVAVMAEVVLYDPKRIQAALVDETGMREHVAVDLGKGAAVAGRSLRGEVTNSKLHLVVHNLPFQSLVANRAAT